MSFWKHFWKLSRNVQKYLKGLLLLILTVETLRLMIPYIMKFMIDFMAKNHKEILGNRQLMRQFTCYAGAFMFSFFSIRCLGILKNRLVWRHVILANVRDQYKKAEEKLLSLSLSYHEREGAGQKAKRTHRGIDKMSQVYENLAYVFVPGVFETLTGVIMLFIYEPATALIVMAALGIHIELSRRVMKTVTPMHLEAYLLDQSIAGRMIEVMVNVNSVQVHGMEKDFCNTHNKQVDTLAEVDNRINSTYIRSDLFRNINISLATCAAFLLTTYHLLHGTLSVGDWILCLWLYMRIMERMFELTQIQQVVGECETPIEGLYALMEEPVMMQDPPHPLAWPTEGDGAGVGMAGEKAAPEEVDYIAFEGVSFAYDAQQKLIVNGNGKEKKRATSLENVSLTIPRQKFIGIAGPTGSGKSTFIKLLMRQYDPMHGEIQVHGLPLQQVRRGDWRKHIGYVAQEVGIFSGTVMENIKLFTPGLSDDAAVEMAKLCHAHGFIMELPDGYQTKVGEFGFKLSGGQRQLIGIVRAMCRRPEVLVLDEATSSLDSESEERVQKAIEELRAKQLCTVLAIAHRLSTVQHADKIFVFEKGRLAEQGTHAELLGQQGLYARLWNKQHAKHQIPIGA